MERAMATCTLSAKCTTATSSTSLRSNATVSSLYPQRLASSSALTSLRRFALPKSSTVRMRKPSSLFVAAAAASSQRTAYFFDEGPQETEEEITRAYEALYGPKFGGLKKERKWDSSPADGGDDDAAGKGGKGRKGKGGMDDAITRPRRGAKDNLEERVVQIRRVTKVVKGGKQLSFRAIVVVGDKKGRVGVGVGKAKEVIAAVQKSGVDARRHMATVPMTKYKTFPHRSDGRYGAAKVMLRPAAPGTGVIAGGSVRVVLEMAGVENALGKELGSQNPLNNARAVVDAVSKMKQFKDVAELRGIPMEELWK